jgi:hypothetical protein
LDYLILLEGRPQIVRCEVTPDAGNGRPGRPGARRRGLLLGLTPLVSEPSWLPGPGQAWLRIAMSDIGRPLRADTSGEGGTLQPSGVPELGSPQFTRFAIEGCPPLPPFFDESPALPLS